MSAVVLDGTLYRLVSALLSFYMRQFSLPVAVGVSWQVDLTQVSARNGEQQHFLLSLTYTNQTLQATALWLK